jgi:hypothetical protein
VHCKCLLLGVKRTRLFAARTSAFDPKRTSASGEPISLWRKSSEHGRRAGGDAGEVEGGEIVERGGGQRFDDWHGDDSGARMAGSSVVWIFLAPSLVRPGAIFQSATETKFFNSFGWTIPFGHSRFLLGRSAMAQQNIGDDGSGENQQQKHSYRFEFHDALRRVQWQESSIHQGSITTVC